MKPGLELKTSQSLTLTPQLQQAIRLLQLSTLDLQAEIQQTLESNPMLDLEEEDNTSENTTEKHEETSADVALAESTIPTDLPVDTVWDDIYPQNYSSRTGSDQGYDFEQFHTKAENLQDHLIWQMQLTPFSALDFAIATAIIDAIDDGCRDCRASAFGCPH